MSRLDRFFDTTSNWTQASAFFAAAFWMYLTDIHAPALVAAFGMVSFVVGAIGKYRRHRLAHHVT